MRTFRRGTSLAIGAWIVALGITVYAAGGSKRTSEECKDDNECARGHCYQRKNSSQKVCVDCSASTISDFRGQTDRYCKDEPRSCDSIPRTSEVSDRYFTVRIENGDRCIAARKNEASQCWDGGDQTHRDVVNQAERARKTCYDEQYTRRGTGGVYECSDSTYSDRAREADDACAAVNRGCEEWSKDDKVVNCRDLEDAMARANRCVVGVERLDSDCLPRLSSHREGQFSRGKRAYDHCKDVLAYKNSNKLCK